MGHVQARKAPDAIPGQWAVSHEVVLLIAQHLADGADIEVTTSQVNRAWSYGEIPGIPNPRVTADGIVADPDRQRGYSISEIASLAALPETIALVKAIQEEQARDAEEVRHAATVAQLAEARKIKQMRKEAAASPLLYAEVVRLAALVAWLADRSFDQPPGETGSLLPELRGEEPGELKY